MAIGNVLANQHRRAETDWSPLASSSPCAAIRTCPLPIPRNGSRAVRTRAPARCDQRAVFFTWWTARGPTEPPPSTDRVAPVTNDEASLTRYNKA